MVHTKINGCLFHLILVSCFSRFNLSLGIIGGRMAQSYSFFVVVGNGDDTCGGSLLSIDTVLTSATCIYDRKRNQWPSADQIYVLHGSFHEEWNLKYYSCEQYKVHFKFDPAKLGGPVPYDIAIIKLENRVEALDRYARPCRFNLASERNHYQLGTVIGVGLINQNPDIKPRGLREGVVVRNETCGKYADDGLNVNLAHQICYSIPGKTAACFGDLGSPLLYTNNRNERCLLGIVSYVFEECDHPDYPSVFISVIAMKNWLRRVFRIIKTLPSLIDGGELFGIYD